MGSISDAIKLQALDDHAKLTIGAYVDKMLEVIKNNDVNIISVSLVQRKMQVGYNMGCDIRQELVRRGFLTIDFYVIPSAQTMHLAGEELSEGSRIEILERQLSLANAMVERSNKLIQELQDQRQEAASKLESLIFDLRK